MRPHKANLERNRVGDHLWLYKDYFHPIEPLFPDYIFWCHFRMSGNLFLTILDGVRDHDSYVKCKIDATGNLGVTFLTKNAM
jgi:hypothetical protein